MRTKHLFYTLALSAAFAACSQEEIVSQQGVANVDLSNRPVVGKVALDLGGLESRGTTVKGGEFNSIEFIKGEDGFGARIIDAYDLDPNYATYGDHPYRNYDMTTYASSNYKYINAGGNAWETDALMVEGNYLFYYPYNEANLARTANTVYLPMKQTVSAEIPNQPIKDLYEGENPAIVGYAFLKAEGQEATVKPELNHVFAYPQFTFVNNYKEPVTEGTNTKYVPKAVTITRMLVKYENNAEDADIKKFYKKGTINHEGFVKAFRNFELTKVKDAAGNQIYAAVEKGNWAKGKSSLLKTAKTADFVDWVTEGADVAGDIEVTFDGGITLDPEESFSFNLVMPAGVYADENLKFVVYLDNDKMFTTEFSVDENNYTTLNFAPGLRYPAEEYNNLDTDPDAKPSKGKLGTITLKDGLQDAVEPAAIIDDVTEFDAYLNSIGDNSATLEEVKDITLVKKENQFTLARNEEGVAYMQIDSKVMELIKKYISKGTVKFYSKMEVAETGAAEAIALDQMIFDHVDILSGDVSVANVTANTVHVHGGTLTVPATYEGEKLGQITVDGGEVVLNKAKFVDYETKTQNFVKVTNVVDEAGEEVSAGKLTVNANQGLRGQRTNYYFVMDAGELVIAAEKTVEFGANDYTQITGGTITNNGTINLVKSFTVAAGVELEHNGAITGAALVNEGTITNNSTLTAVNQFGGKIKMGNVTSYLYVSGTEGIVDNTKLAEVDNNGVQTVYAEMDSFADAKEANFDESSAINKVVVTGLWTVDGKPTGEGWEKVKTVEFNGGGLYVNASETLDLREKQIIIAANTVWRGRSTGNIYTDLDKAYFTYRTLTNGKKATLTINTVNHKFDTTKTATVDGVSVTLSNEAQYETAEITVDGVKKTVLTSIEIHTAQDMMSFLALYNAKKVHSGEGTPAEITLEADIDMSGMTWEPLYLNHGIFDGENHVISNLNTEGDRQAGLFGYAAGTTIKDLTVRNAQVTAAQAGVFAGNAEGVTMQNCKLEGTVIVNWKKYDAESYNGVGAAVGVVSNTSTIGVDASNARITINKEGITYPTGHSAETTTNLVGVVYGGTYNIE